MAKKLYFQARRECGYSLQLVVDLESKEFEVGYCLAHWCDIITLKSKKELHQLADTFAGFGFRRVEK